MASFDFIEAASTGYKFTVKHRQFISKLALVPVLIKVVVMGAVIFFGLESQHLRQGLIMFPSFVAEGWLVSQIIRAAIFKEFGLVRLSGEANQDRRRFELRAQCILAGTIIYVLTKMATYLFAGLLMTEVERMQGNIGDATAAPDAGGFDFVIAVLALGIALWGFRYLWLYVPAALGYSVEGFLKRIKGIKSSFYMMGLWILCFIPIMTLAMLIMQGLLGGADSYSDVSPVSVLFVVVVQAFAETAIVIVASVGMAVGVQSIYANAKR